MRVGRKILALLLCCVLLLTLLPMGAVWADDELPIIPIVPIYKGECGVEGDNLTWTLHSGTGVLMIVGSGAMMDYDTTNQPWYQWRAKVKSISFPDAITVIGANAFRNCTQLTSAAVPEGVQRIGTNAFALCTALTALTLECPDCVVADGSATLGEPNLTVITADCGGSVAAYALEKGYQTALRHLAYTQTVTAPTCTEAGYTTHSCPRCGDSYTDGELPALGHDWTQPRYQWTTDNRQVTATRTCRRDASHVETETVQTVAVITTPAGCTTPGQTTYTGTFENPAFETQTKTLTDVPATGHTPGEPVEEKRVEPSCTQKGSYETAVYCTVCGAELSRAKYEVPALGHTPGEPVEENRVEPGCTQKGGYDAVVYCTVCGAELSRSKVELPAPGHTPGEAVEENRVAPTCTEKGGYDTVTYCTVCRAELSRVHTELAALGHSAGEPLEENLVAPGCTQDGGYDTVTYCTACQAELSRIHTVLAALGHKPGDALTENRVEPSCTEKGGYDAVVLCTVCGAELSRTRVELAAPGHTPGTAVEENRVAASCTEKGGYDSVVYCTVCRAELQREHVVLPMLAHTPGATVEENRAEPRCTEQGGYDTVTTCTVCGVELSRVHTVLEALGHTPGAAVEENRVEPDCTTVGGYDTVSYCTVCKAELNRTHTVLAALGHTPGAAVEENRVEPGCTVKGSYDAVIYCTVCGAELSRTAVELLPLGHHYGSVVTEPTCTEGGYTTYTCDRCGDVRVANETPAKDHSWDEGTVTLAPTEDDEGVLTFTCTRCGATQTQAIPKTDHVHHYTDVVTPPTCTEGGYTTHSCARCGASYVDSYVEALGHDWTLPRYYWTAENTLVTAGRSCKRDPSHRETETVRATAVVTKPATCTEDGETTYAGTFMNPAFEPQSKTVSNLPATGHTPGTPVEENRVVPTCTAGGGYDTVTYCAACKLELERVYTALEATGHDWDSPRYVWSADNGEVTASRSCRNDSGHVETETVKTSSAVTLAPTCTAQGQTTYTAAFTNAAFETQTKTLTNLAALGHTPGAAVEENRTAPTCTADGGFDTVIYCTVCGAELHREHIVLAATGHTPAAAVEENRVEPTCTGTGGVDSVVYCAVCGAELSRTHSELSALGHDWEAPQYLWSADNGEVTASRCCRRDPSHIETETVAAVGEITKPATCTDKGETCYTATFEDPAFAVQTKTVEDLAALGHTPGEPVEENRIAPGCTEIGGFDTVTYCTVCGAELNRAHTALPALGHTPGEAVEENRVEPTCTEIGGYDSVVYCTVCGAELSRTKIELPAPGHTPGAPVEENRVAPTCTEIGGYDSVVCCTVCGAELSRAHIELSALGHTPGEAVEENRVVPNCTEPGGYQTVTYCTFCGAELTREYTELPALGHVPGEPVEENRVEPTCTEAGGFDTVVYCTVCEAELRREHTELDAIGHDWNEPEYVWAEDYSTATATRVCKNDETHVETETVETTSAVTKEATVDEEGEIVYTAVFKNTAFETQTMAVSTPKLEPPVIENPFADVAEGKYFYDAVLWAVNHEPQITNGVDSTHFGPDRACTRGQVVTFLWRAAGEPSMEGAGIDVAGTGYVAGDDFDVPFVDVKENAYYYKAVLWAVENGITKGTDETHFGPDKVCTRGQVVTFLWRAGGSKEPAKTDHPFVDVASGKYYYRAVLWAVENGITKGTDDTHFSPDKDCTRGQVVTFLYRAEG